MKFFVILIIVFVAALAAFTFVPSLFEKEETPRKGTSTITDVPGEDGNKADSSSSSTYDWTQRHVNMIGDSLTLSAVAQLEKAMPNSTIDGKVSRGMTEGVKIYRTWVSEGMVEDDDILVIALANNIETGTITQLDSLISELGPKKNIVLMTGHGRENMKPVNEYIRTLPTDHENIVVADWDVAISAYPSWLADDGLHIANSQGMKLYADLIVDALTQTEPIL